MLRHITALTLILSLVSPSWWPAPAGRRAEAFPLPPPFAPAMSHRGSLEVRFPPGFGKPADPRFFSYAFAWSIRCPERMRPAGLAAELKTYYDGLVTTYGNPSSAPFTGTQVEVECGEGALVARVETHDPFFTHAPLKLAIRAREVPGAVAGHRTWLFLASPRPEAPEVRAAFADVEAQLGKGR